MPDLPADFRGTHRACDRWRRFAVNIAPAGECDRLAVEQLTLGFALLMRSEFVASSNFGLLTAVCLLTALIIDLTEQAEDMRPILEFARKAQDVRQLEMFAVYSDTGQQLQQFIDYELKLQSVILLPEEEAKLRGAMDDVKRVLPSAELVPLVVRRQVPELAELTERPGLRRRRGGCRGRRRSPRRWRRCRRACPRR